MSSRAERRVARPWRKLTQRAAWLGWLGRSGASSCGQEVGTAGAAERAAATRRFTGLADREPEQEAMPSEQLSSSWASSWPNRFSGKEKRVREHNSRPFLMLSIRLIRSRIKRPIDAASAHRPTCHRS